MMKLSRKLARESGQSTTELALMMPVIFALFFWAIQAQIVLAGMHQAAYASFASARTLTVKHQGQKDPSETMKRILTGKVFTESEAGPADLSEGMRSPGSKWGTTDGVSVHLPQFASLPYARGLLNFDLDIPAHLGPDEWDPMLTAKDGGPMYSGDDGQACWYTDNNLKDSSGC